MMMSASPTIFAQGRVLNEDHLRTDINRLNQQAVIVIHISISTWPMSGDEIQRAIVLAKKSDNTQQKVIDSVQAVIKADNNNFKTSLFAESD